MFVVLHEPFIRMNIKANEDVELLNLGFQNVRNCFFLYFRGRNTRILNLSHCTVRYVESSGYFA